MADAGTINIELAYALPGKQWLEKFAVADGTTVRDAVIQLLPSTDFAKTDSLDPERCPVGIFGVRVPDTQLLKDGDRVEIYRPLAHDPREQRRALAARGESMGSK